MSLLKYTILSAALTLACAPASHAAPVTPIQHVVLISIDGLHAFDLRHFIQTHPHSTLADLARHGVEYSQDFTPAPADSFPGLMALTTGGTPGQTGIYYDVSYDRALSPPGSACQTLGTTVTYNESVDGPGAAAGLPSINDDLLPRDPRKNCSPVYPHSYLRVNTIFNVVRDAGGYTAWIDKHPVYEIVEGPNGAGVNDLYTPEIGEDAEGNLTKGTDKITASINRTEHYDDHKMDALINEMRGHTHDGKSSAPVPTLAGLNLQAVNVGQKKAGYLNAQGTPTPALNGAIENCDHQIGRLMDTLKAQHLQSDTLVIVTAKHGNGPIAPHLARRLDRTLLAHQIDAAAPGALAQITTDRGALIWLHQARDTSEVVHALEQNRKPLGIKTVLSGNALRQHFRVAAGDDRIPDIIIIPQPGVIYVKAGDHKLAEHGGWSDHDRHVALLIANPHLHHQGVVVRRKVAAIQVAPTILAALGLNPGDLQAVATSHITVLPDGRMIHSH